jgi:hypothetical protein
MKFIVVILLVFSGIAQAQDISNPALLQAPQSGSAQATAQENCLETLVKNVFAEGAAGPYQKIVISLSGPFRADQTVGGGPANIAEYSGEVDITQGSSFPTLDSVTLSLSTTQGDDWQESHDIAGYFTFTTGKMLSQASVTIASSGKSFPVDLSSCSSVLQNGS